MPLLVRFTLPPVTDAALACLDPRWRLAALGVALLTVACLRTLPAAALGLVGTLLLACLARMPWRWFLARLAVIGLLLLAFVVPLPWFANFSFAGVVLCKALALFTLAAALLVAAPLEVSLKAMRALYVPALLVHLTLLSYRYLFVLGDELARLRVALRVRSR